MHGQAGTVLQIVDPAEKDLITVADIMVSPASISIQTHLEQSILKRPERVSRVHACLHGVYE